MGASVLPGLFFLKKVVAQGIVLERKPLLCGVAYYDSVNT